MHNKQNRETAWLAHRSRWTAQKRRASVAGGRKQRGQPHQKFLPDAPPVPFALTIGGLTLTAPSNTEIKKTPALAPELREGASSITDCLPDADRRRPLLLTSLMVITVEIRCLPSSRLEFSIDAQEPQLQPHRRMPLPLHSTACPTAKADETNQIRSLSSGQCLAEVTQPVAYLKRRRKRFTGAGSSTATAT